jgi:hypothetical protein
LQPKVNKIKKISNLFSIVLVNKTLMYRRTFDHGSSDRQHETVRQRNVSAAAAAAAVDEEEDELLVASPPNSDMMLDRAAVMVEYS